MVNATEMAKAGGKEISRFLDNKNTQDFIGELIKSKNFLDFILSNYPEKGVIRNGFSEEELYNFVIQSERGRYGGTLFYFLALSSKQLLK